MQTQSTTYHAADTVLILWMLMLMELVVVMLRPTVLTQSVETPTPRMDKVRVSHWRQCEYECWY